MEGAATERSMRSSRDFMNFLIEARVSPPSTQLMLRANLILQMCPQEEYTLRNPFSFSRYNSQQSLTISSSMPNHPSQQPNCNHTETFFLPQQQGKGLKMLTKGLTLTHSNAVDISADKYVNPSYKSSPRFYQPLSISRATHAIQHKPYHAGLVLLPSTLWPHCLARDRLWLWCPARSRSGVIGEIEVSETDLERILEVINVSWVKETRDTYGAGLLAYHVFCDSHNISEGDRSPASLILIIAFISSCVGLYAGGTLASYVFGV